MLPSSLYIGLTSGYLRLLESRGTPYTLKKTSNSTLSLVITSLRLSTFHESVSARLALERVRARCCYLVVGSRVNRTCIQGVLPLGVLETRRQVFNPPTWCGAASTIMCGGCGHAHPLWRSSLVESGIKVTGELGVSLGRLAFVANQGVPGTDLVVEKRYSC